MPYNVPGFAVRPGEDTNGAANNLDLFLKVWSGEVLAAFEPKTVMEGRVTVRRINSGKTAQFPVLGRVDAYYHVAGNEVTTASTEQTEVVIGIDGALTAAIRLTDLEQAMSHYDNRSQWVEEIARAHARTMDQQLLQLGVLAARKAENLPGTGQGGTVLPADVEGGDNLTTDFRKDALLLAAAIYEASARMDMMGTPEGERAALMLPRTYNALIQARELINKEIGGMGSYGEGKIWQIGGIDLVKTPNFPSTLIDATSGTRFGNQTPNSYTGRQYGGDFSKTAALVMHPSALGTVRLLDLRTEVDREVAKRCYLIVTDQAVGHDILRPESAVEIANA